MLGQPPHRTKSRHHAAIVRALTCMLVLVALLSGQAHYIIAHRLASARSRSSGVSRRIDSDRQDSNVRGIGKRAPTVSAHLEVAVDSDRSAVPQIDIPAVLTKTLEAVLMADLYIVRQLAAFAGHHYSHAPPLARISRAPPVSFV